MRSEIFSYSIKCYFFTYPLMEIWKMAKVEIGLLLNFLYEVISFKR